MSEIRISIDPTNHQRLPEAAHAASAGEWCSERGYYASAAAFMSLAHALEIDQGMTDAKSGVMFPEPTGCRHDGPSCERCREPLVSVPLIGTTRDEQPRTPEGDVTSSAYLTPDTEQGAGPLPNDARRSLGHEPIVGQGEH